MSIIEAVRKYLQTCPLLKGGTLNVDFLPPEAATYSVDVVPVKPVLKAYMDGSSQRQFLFVLATRTYYGEFVRQQLDNLCFFEEFAEWLDKQNRTRSFPDLGDRTKRAKTGGHDLRLCFRHPIRTRHGIRSSAACPISRKENDK